MRPAHRLGKKDRCLIARDNRQSVEHMGRPETDVGQILSQSESSHRKPQLVPVAGDGSPERKPRRPGRPSRIEKIRASCGSDDELPPPEQDVSLNLRETAEFLGIGRTSLWQMMRSGDAPPSTIYAGVRRFVLSDIIEWRKGLRRES